jgi:sialate O-acetylesterase
MALAAGKLVYGKKSLVSSGPLFKAMEIKGDKMVLEFESKGSGLVSRGGDLKGFAVAGEDGKYVWADASIKDDKVMVWSDQVEKPVKVRYAWADNPDTANLYNREGLPASPFQAGD